MLQKFIGLSPRIQWRSSSFFLTFFKIPETVFHVILHWCISNSDRYTLKFCLINYELNFHLLVLKNYFFPFSRFSKIVTCTLFTSDRIIRIKNFLTLEKQTIYLSYFNKEKGVPGVEVGGGGCARTVTFLKIDLYLNNTFLRASSISYENTFYSKQNYKNNY